ncbi:hypothetical protein BJV78DRAFT_1354257 [Lactifluus subvellereus]|nr:hypothetical protein BJV78DRAFT_1354257 [Lactifluus subvellereus]
MRRIWAVRGARCALHVYKVSVDGDCDHGLSVTVNEFSKSHSEAHQPSIHGLKGRKACRRHRKEFFNQQGRNTISFQRVTIGSLPDNVLLDIFDFYQKWHTWSGLASAHSTGASRYLLGRICPTSTVTLLSGIQFPALPKLLLSARGLVYLTLHSVPHTGYISPEAMVTCLSALTKLETFGLRFQSPSSRPDRGSQRPLPLTRVDLPALTWLDFEGVSEYLEDLLARINTPVITTTFITFFNRVVFNIPQLFEYLSRTEALGSAKRAELFFNKEPAYIWDGLDELIAPALQELTGVRVMEVLPALHNLFVMDPHPSGSARQAIEPFITARQLSNQPVTVHWGMDREEFVHW